MTGHRVRRALLSVHDKTGLVPFARGLQERGVELISTGGTARELAGAGITVRDVQDVTGWPEMLDGRVKTLHPLIHAGLLARREDPSHVRQAAERAVPLIDLIAVNLYPFEETALRSPTDPRELIEMIDIGGPAMIRSAGKNHASVAVVVDPVDYDRVRDAVASSGGVPDPVRRELAAKAFAHTAAYDALIAHELTRLSGGPAFPDVLSLGFRKKSDLRYGENPHQAAALYQDPLEVVPCPVAAEQIHGKELSYNNILDLDAAWRLACDFDATACAVVKHSNPAGVALGESPAEACRFAVACDPVSAFGGVVAFNCEVDQEAGREMASFFLEAVVAPAFAEGALDVLRSRRHLRIMRTGRAARVPPGRELRRVVGGLLAQERDRSVETASELKVVTRRAPSPDEVRSLLFAWTVVRHVTSNAIVYARGSATIGIGAGQMSRVDAVRFGAAKAAGSLSGSVLASEAFFPFRDGVDEAARAGVTAIIQPGGSVKDTETIAAADEHGLAMVFTGRRHFRH